MKGLKLLGHPLHPALVHFPVASWTAVLVTDILFLIVGGAIWWRLSLWLLVIGVVTAAGAMTAGFVDLVALPSGQLSQRRALRHMYVMSTAWTIYAIDLLLRSLVKGAPGGLLAWAGLALSAIGFCALVVGTHFGAHLVYDLGVGQTEKKSM